MKPIKVSCVCLLALFMFVSGAVAGESSPPLSLYGIEGYGGVAVTYSAYLVNPADKGHFFGVNDHLTISGGYFALGDVLDEENSNGYALKAKWEF